MRQLGHSIFQMPIDFICNRWIQHEALWTLIQLHNCLVQFYFKCAFFWPFQSTKLNQINAKFQSNYDWNISRVFQFPIAGDFYTMNNICELISLHFIAIQLQINEQVDELLIISTIETNRQQYAQKHLSCHFFCNPFFISRFEFTLIYIIQLHLICINIFLNKSVFSGYLWIGRNF